MESINSASKKSSKKLSNIRTYIAAWLFLLIPSTNVQSKDTKINTGENYVSEWKPSVAENNDVVTSHEVIFKNGIKKVLKEINSMDQIPAGWKQIVYVWDEGNIKGKPIAPEAVEKMELPDRFDISPRGVTQNSIPHIYFTLGNRVFSITPDIGTIKSMKLTAESFIIEVSVLFGVVNEEIVYDKEEKLPDLIYRLRMTPREKGKKTGFRSTTVKEI